jgi:hypothetical protein
MIELATTEKKTTKADQVRAYVAKNPKAKPQEIADAVGTGLQYVYTVMWNVKKKAKAQRAKAKAIKTQQQVLKGAVEHWKNISLASTGIPYYKDSVTDTTPKRMAQLAFEAGKPKVRMEGVTHNVPVQIEMFKPKADPVNHPAHYKVGGIETIDFIEAKKLNYRLGNVIKYLTRADHKGNKLEDLKKAQWYLEREIESLS